MLAPTSKQRSPGWRNDEYKDLARCLCRLATGLSPSVHRWTVSAACFAPRRTVRKGLTSAAPRGSADGVVASLLLLPSFTGGSSRGRRPSPENASQVRRHEASSSSCDLAPRRPRRGGTHRQR